MRLPVKTAVLAALAAVLSACGATPPPVSISAARSIANGPESDYPVLVGDPYVVDEVTYVPSDTMNYDEVGYAAADADAGPGITAAHHTLPVPSYVEVTALDTGKTALVRVERRGPMTSTRLVALSGDALAQIGIGDGAPVRVRRVNPPEDERAKLRADQAVSLRMATPQGLLGVLKRKLPTAGSASLADPRQAAVSGRAPDAVVLANLPAPAAAPQLARTKSTPSAAPPIAVRAVAATVAASPPPAVLEGKYVVQLGTFANHGNAASLAAKAAGHVVTSGRFALVQVGPFASRGQAEQALAKLRGQGYSDASIRTLR